jgi:steroid 5-alpha reductase family enzyme
MFEFVDNMMSFLYGSMACLGVFVITWVISVMLKNTGIVDIIWGLAFTVQALVFYLTSNFQENFSWYRAFLVALVCAHGLRLSIYILIRAIGKPEDKRYTELFRNKFGGNFWWISLFTVFLFQLIINLIVGFPIFAFACSTKKEIENISYGIGMAIMFFGTVYETIADLQLYFFKKNPANKGKVLNRGLWFYSRHPNYFGEGVFWIGLYIVNISAGIYFTAFSPVIMIIFLLFVSGVTINEQFMKKNYSDEYKHYILSTSSYIPWCKKEVANLDNDYEQKA